MNRDHMRAYYLGHINYHLMRLRDVMDGAPSNYEYPIEKIRKARLSVRENPKTALKHCRSALKVAEKEAVLSMEYERLTTGLPINESALPKDIIHHIGSYSVSIRKGDIGSASSAIKKLRRSLINGDISSELSARMDADAVSSENPVANLLITNKCQKDIVLNDVRITGNVQMDDIPISRRSIRSGDMITIPVRFVSNSPCTARLEVTVVFTTELAPKELSFGFTVRLD